jgi:O-antigen ligase
MIWRSFCEFMSWVLAVFGLWLFLVPEIDMLNPPDFPTIIISYPVAAVVVFGFSFFLMAALLSKTNFWLKSVGLVCCSLGVFGHLHKAMVFMGSVTALTVIVLSYQMTKNKYVIFRSIKLVFATACIIFSLNLAIGGHISSYAVQVFKTKYLHLPDTNDVVIPDSSEWLDRLSGGRFEIWSETWNRWKASPVFGSGFGQQSSSLRLYSYESVPWHNTWLEVPIAVGTVGSIIFLGFILWWIRRARIVFRSHENTTPLISCLAYLAGAAALHLVTSGLVFFTVNVLIALTLGAIVGRSSYLAIPHMARNK